VADWSFLTTHARVLVCIAHDPGARLRDIAARLGITERRAHGIISDLAEAGYVVRRKDGRRNRYQIQAHLPLPGPGSREPAIGEIVALFAAQGRLVTGPAQASDADASDIRQAQNPLTSRPAGPSQQPARPDAIGSYLTGEVNG
jgi:predicted ArsR family transcriptional regulator